jgi:hypothetical protein
LAHNLAENGREGIELFSKIRALTLAKGPSLLVITGSESRREFDYKEKVLKQIKSDMDGVFLPLVEDPKMGKKLIWHIIRATTANRETFRLMAEQQASFGARDSWGLGIKEAIEAIRLKRKYVEKDRFLDDGIDNTWVLSYEHGHIGHGEELFLLDPSDPSIRKYMLEYIHETWQASLDKALGHHQTVRGDMGHDLFGPRTSDYHRWARKIKKAFDPNGASESSFYITAKE